jgi:two-component system, sensor histidine kinase
MVRKLILRFADLGILPKLLISFLVLSVVPLIILGYLADKNLSDAGFQAVLRAEDMGKVNLQAAKDIGKTSIGDSVQALDRKATESIELRTVELAMRIADFLYERDKDILILSSFKPDPEKYLNVYLSLKKDVIVTETGTTLKTKRENAADLQSKNPENKEAWQHRPPSGFKKTLKPLYKEITFIDLEGLEKIKVVNGKISGNLMNISRRENTYCKAEDYFSHLNRLNKGEIYVSRVIGSYIKGWLYKTPEGIRVKPESAYAGKENPKGKKFEGLIRWATPVYNEKGEKTGYVTMALDHTHIMEFTDHVIPTEERFTVLSDGGSGNYAFIWDNNDKCISHARDFFICGYNPTTGKEVPGWLSQFTYDEYKNRGLPLGEFVNKLPSFRNFTQKKSGSIEQMKLGNIALDCRVLDTAPQCQGWHEGTEDGGSGSFLILWSGLWKLTTYAAIPYYTGAYGQSKRGFGYVTIGANVDDFHKDANITRTKIKNSIDHEGKEILLANITTRKLIGERAAHNRKIVTIIAVIAGLAVIGTSFIISLNITRPLRRLTEVAVDMSKGNYEQSIEVKSTNEVGRLAKSFNEMAKVVSEVDRMKSDFVTIASHELRTPIQAMLLGISGVLEGYSGKIDEEAKEDLEMARVGIERLMRLVTNFLDLSRIEASKFEITTTETPVADIIDLAVKELSDLADTRNHLIIKDIPANIGNIKVDRDRMIQVMVNLLSNAIKYTPEGGKIILKAEREDENILISVIDNGYGVPEWAREEIFNKFFQADSIMSQTVGGTGLGLTITRGILEKHGGDISCKSPISETEFPDLPLGKERKGSVFIIHLPAPHSSNV